MRKHLFFGLFLAVWLTAGAVSLSAQVQCTDQTLRGAYMLTSGGSLSFHMAKPGDEGDDNKDMKRDAQDKGNPPTPTVPFRGLGRVSFDGHGAFSGTFTGSFGGKIITGEFADGTVKTNADCSAQVKFSLKSADLPVALGPLRYAFLIFTEGQAGNGILIDPAGSVVQAELKRLGPAFFN